MTVTLDAPAALSPAAPAIDNIPPTKTLPELLDKLDNLGNADVIAEFFLTEGVRGVRKNSVKCPIAKWLAVETGGKYSVGSASVCPVHTADTDLTLANWGHHLPPAAQEFVLRFDKGEFDDLAVQPTPTRRDQVCEYVSDAILAAFGVELKGLSWL